MRNVLFLLFFIWTLPSLAQDGSDSNPDFESLKGMPLIEALKYLDQNHSIRFSYNPSALAGMVIPSFDDKINNTEQFLMLSLAGRDLSFENIAGTYVIYPSASAPEQPAFRTDLAISGLVEDGKTGEALPYATILLTGTDITTISNTEGMFTLLKVPTDTLTIQIRYLGYKPLKISLDSVDTDNTLHCKMNLEQRALPFIEISARPENLVEIDRKPSQLTFNPSQISQLPSLGENDLFSALRRLPGIGGGQDASSGLSIRGANSDQNLVLFDGITVYHVDHFFGFLSAFNSNMVKNVQVMKGGFEAKYGGRTAGVVNITGIDGNKVKPSLLLEANLLSANVLAELPIVQEKASLTVGYRRAYTDIIQTGAYQNLFNNIFNSSIPNSDGSTDVFDGDNEPDYTYYDFNAKFNFRPTKNDAISLSYYEGEDDVKITFLGSFEELQRESMDDTNWGNKGGSIKWSRKWTKSFFSYINYGTSNYTSDLIAEESFYTNRDTLLSQLFFEQHVGLRDNTIRFDNTWELNPKSKLNFGYNYTKNKITLQAQNQATILQDSIQTGLSHAGYADFSQQFKKWNFSLGLRGTYYDLMDEIYLDPRFSLSYAVNKNISIKGAYGIYKQMIRRLNERNLYLSVPETWALSSEATVPVLSSTHYILGMSLQKGGWTFDVEGYFKSEDGTVEYLFPEFGNPSGNLDLFAIGGQKEILGADILLKKNLNNHDVLIGYTYLQSKSKFSEFNNNKSFNSSGVSAHEINFVYHYQVKRWDFSAGFVFASGTAYTSVLGTFIITLPSGEQQQFISLGEINAANYEPYHRLDIEGSYTLPIKKGSLQVGVSLYNVYNHLNVKFIDYYEIPIEGSPFYSLGTNKVYTLGFTPSFFIKLRL